MTYEISMTPQSKDDLRGIYEYIAFDLQSPQNAAGQLDRLEKSIDSLDEMPDRFRIYDKEPWRSRNLHIMPVDNYLVFYVPDHEEKHLLNESSNRLFLFARSDPSIFMSIFNGGKC